MSAQFNRCGRKGGVVFFFFFNRAVCLVVKHTEERDMVKIICKNISFILFPFTICVNIFLCFAKMYYHPPHIESYAAM